MDTSNSSPAGASLLDFDSGASLSGMTAGSGSNPSQGSQMSMGQPGGSQNGGMVASTSNTTISNGFIGSNESDPASVLALDPTFGPDLSTRYQEEEQWSMNFKPKQPKIPRESGDPVADWKYEMRREAQQIIPGLYVGPYQSSRLLEPLQTLGITHIVCVYDNREKLFVKPRFPEHFTYLALEVRDAQDQNVIRVFPQVRAFVDQALQQGGRVLIHCGDGISRSPALAIAYLMMTFNVTHEEAYLHVQARRFCASPNLNFQRQIDAFEDIHGASLAMTEHAKQLQQANASTDSGFAGNGHSATRRKRGAAAEDDDEGEGDEDLQERNLHAQRKRKGSDEEEVHHYVGEQVMDMN